MDLKELGYCEHFENCFGEHDAQTFAPARVTRRDRQTWTVSAAEGEFVATASGRFIHDATDSGQWPTVGDWVVIQARPSEQNATIHSILPRLGCFSRKAASSGGMPDSGGRTDLQVLAANIDIAFLVAALDHDFNLRRLERYLLTAYDSGTKPVVLLNKADLCEDCEAVKAEVEMIAFGVDILIVSGTENQGLDQLHNTLGPGKTGVMLGSSGVGKSTLINSLLGTERLKTSAVREDDSRGRHTTTHRELIVLPQGGILIDTPGIRELQLWTDEENLKSAFEDIENLARNCRFRDCQHNSEPGCAVREGIASGVLDASRLESFRKLQKEIRRLEERQSGKARHLERIRGKQFSSMVNEAIKMGKRRR